MNQPVKHYPIQKLLSIIIMLAIGLTACDLWPEDDDVSVDLDPDLFGFWVLKDSAGNPAHSWKFNDDATAVQRVYDGDYDWVDNEYHWNWEIENEQLKLYVDYGVPRYITYKIEGNLLYFWSDEINDWSVPYHKE